MTKSIPKDRMREIDAAVGSPLQGGLLQYEARLKEETDKDHSLLQYLSQSLEHRPPRKFPQREPKDIIGKLSTTDYRDPASLMALRTNLELCVTGNIELAKNSDELFIIAPDPGAVLPAHVPPTTVPPIEVQINASPSIHPGLLTLDFKSTELTSPGMVQEPLGLMEGIQIPTFVLPFGRLLRRDNRPIEDFGDTGTERNPKRRELEKTNYVVVVDAIHPEHPVWLLFNCFPMNEDGDREKIDPSKQPVVFQDVGHNFSAAQLFAGAKDWHNLHGNVSLDTLQLSMQKTLVNHVITIGDANIEEVNNAFNQPATYLSSR